MRFQIWIQSRISIRYYDGDIVHIDEDKIEYVDFQHCKIPKEQQKKNQRES